jgi:uncharacterized protein (TIGR03089 family)
VQLASPPRQDPDASDLAAAVRAAQTRLGAAPVVSVLFPEGRQEQGMASLAQWAAKGAHLLETDLLLSPGDTIRLDAPLSWTSAAVALAAWWAGVSITLDDAADVTVAHESRTATNGEVFVVGDRLDGAPARPGDAEPWVRAVQSFPDMPPMPRARPETVALRAGGQVCTQQELLERARAMEPDVGTIGVDADTVDAASGLIAVAVRPLVRGRPTVVLRGVARDAAAGDRVERWLAAA